MRIRPRVPLAVFLCLLALVSGCRPRAAATSPGRALYTGPTQTMAEVVAAINANNAKLPTLWAKLYFDSHGPGQPTFNGDGTLVYQAPRGMRVVGTKPFAGSLFEIGSSPERYWLSLAPPNEPSRLWWGRYANLGKPCVDTRQLPIRPDLVLQVLGVGTVDTNFLAPPAPVMRFNNDARAYMFVWSVPAGDRWVAQKEIWYDLDTKLPSRVFLFDENGRVVLKAELSDHAPVDVSDLPLDQRPRVARKYKLYFPDTRATMTFDLRAYDEVYLDYKGVPTRRGIPFPDERKFDEVIALDKDCAE